MRKNTILGGLIFVGPMVLAQFRKKEEKPYGLFEKPPLYQKATGIPSCYLFPEFYYNDDLSNRAYQLFIGKDTLAVIKQSAYPPYRMKSLHLYRFPEGKLLQEITHKRMSELLGQTVHITPQLEIVSWEGRLGLLGVYDGKTGTLLKVTRLLSDYTAKKFYKRILADIDDEFAVFYDYRDETYTVLNYRTGSIVDELIAPVGYRFTSSSKILRKKRQFIAGIVPADARLDSLKLKPFEGIGEGFITEASAPNIFNKKVDKEASIPKPKSYLFFKPTISESERNTSLIVYSLDSKQAIDIEAPHDSILAQKPILLDFVVSSNDSVIVARYDTPEEIKYIKYSLIDQNKYDCEPILERYGFKYIKKEKTIERVGKGVLTLLAGGSSDMVSAAMSKVPPKLFYDYPLLDISPNGKYLIHEGYNYIANSNSRSNIQGIAGGTSIIDIKTGEVVHYHCNDQVQLNYPININGLYFHANGTSLTDNKKQVKMAFSFEKLKEMNQNPFKK